MTRPGAAGRALWTVMKKGVRWAVMERAILGLRESPPGHPRSGHKHLSQLS